MDLRVRRVEHVDDAALSAVLALGKRNAHFLGFMPKGGYVERAAKGTILVAESDGRLVGYVMYDLPRAVVHVVHLCVADDARGGGVARALVEALSVRHADRRGIELLVRNDFPARQAWERLGFSARGEISGRGLIARDKTRMWFEHGHTDLFSWTGDPTAAVAAIVDASVFYDLHGASERSIDAATPELAEAIALGEVELIVCDQLRREISHHGNREQRDRLRAECLGYRDVAVSARDVSRRTDQMRTELLKSGCSALSERDVEDLRYAATASLAGVGYVISKDERFPRWAAAALHTHKVRVLLPRAAVIRVDEVRRRGLFAPRALQETTLERSNVGSADVGDLRDRFLNRAAGERRAEFNRLISTALSRRSGQCELLMHERNAIALWSTEIRGQHLHVDVLRVDQRSDISDALIDQVLFLFRDTARAKGVAGVVLSDPALQTAVTAQLTAACYVSWKRAWWSLTPSGIRSRAAWLRELEDAGPGSSAEYESIRRSFARGRMLAIEEAAELESKLWPAKLAAGPAPTFLVPINQLWSSRLFGVPAALERRTTVLGLSRQHVYYRSPQGERPVVGGRVVWYATQGRSKRSMLAPQVFACSRIEEVVEDDPSVLYERFQSLGVYEREHVQEASRRGRVQAIRFSDTEILLRPVGLDALRAIAARHRQTLHLRSPQRLGPHVFDDIYEAGGAAGG